jgi:hypothetical protein
MSWKMEQRPNKSAIVGYVASFKFVTYVLRQSIEATDLDKERDRLQAFVKL